ncbi:PH domain-containing protein [Spongisporangium articulatum]|uniref:PH domain-containing protein n=1 Tax=Spongisporangium articulatum TaxID=3362603 RepID=A0ABW8AQN8_9ACTN
MPFPDKLLADDERSILTLHRHIKVLAGPFALLLLVIAAIAVPALLTDVGSWPVWLWVLIAVVAVVVLLPWFVWPFVVWRTTVYAITTRRLIMRNGVFSRSGHDMPLARLNDVAFEHTFIERLLGAGTLMVESAGERGQLTLTDIPKVELVQRTLYRLAEDLNPRAEERTLDPALAEQLEREFDDDYHGDDPKS